MEGGDEMKDKYGPSSAEVPVPGHSVFTVSGS